MTPAVEARDLFRVYATREGSAAALQGLSLEIAEGEIVVVFGPSGSGKTTLLRIVGALDAPSAGVVRVHGVDLRRLRGRARDRFRADVIGYVDQHYSRLLAPELTARQIVELPLALRGDGPAARRRRAGELFERVGLADRADARPSELSGGEQQRVALCAALVRSPRLILADEPTGELDAQTAQGVYTLIRDLSREQRSAASDRQPRHRLGRHRRPDDPGARRPRERRGPSGRGDPRRGADGLGPAAGGSPRAFRHRVEGTTLACGLHDLADFRRGACTRFRGALAERPAAAEPVEPRGRAPARRTPICDRCGGHGAERGLPDGPHHRDHGPVGIGEDDRPPPTGRSRSPDGGPGDRAGSPGLRVEPRREGCCSSQRRGRDYPGSAARAVPERA